MMPEGTNSLEGLEDKIKNQKVGGETDNKKGREEGKKQENYRTNLRGLVPKYQEFKKMKRKKIEGKK